MVQAGTAVQPSGTAHAEAEEPSAATSTPADDVISRVKDRYLQLRPSERRVADVILSDVPFAIDASNAALARRAGVSEPTVTRFCRSVGCRGVRDLKLRLAQSLVVGSLYLAPMAEAAAPDGAAEPGWWTSVLQEAHEALNQAERQLDRAAVDQAAKLIAGASQVAAFGLGGSSAALCQEVQFRLFRYGVPITACWEPYMMRMLAATLKRGDVAIAVSATGRTGEVVESLEIARQYGARTIAITAPETDLAGTADVALTVAVREYPDILTPTASRYAFLAAIDLMAAATGYRIGEPARETLRRIKLAAQTHRLGNEMEPLGD